LIYKKYISDTQGKREVRENKRYLGQLAAYLDECPSLSSRINALKFYDKALFRLFEQYYECIDKPVALQKERRDIGVEAGVLAGASLTSLSFSGLETFEYLTATEYDKSIKPVIGFFVDFKLLRSNGMRISNDFMYTAFDIMGSGSGTINSTSQFTSNSRFNYQLLKWIPSFQVSLARQGALYVSLGVSIAAMLKSDTEVSITYGGSGGTTTDKEFETRSVECGVIGGLGSHLGRFSFEARYELTTGISSFYRLNSQVRHVYGTLGYRLSRSR
jgi:hypothetical protein